MCRVSAVWGLALPQGFAWIVSCTKSRRRNPGHLGSSLARVNEGDLGQVVKLLLDVHLPGRDPSLYLPGNRNWFTREPVERWWIKQPEWDEPQAEEWISCSQTQPRCCYLVAPVSRCPPAFEFLLFILRVPSACCL